MENTLIFATCTANSGFLSTICEISYYFFFIPFESETLKKCTVDCNPKVKHLHLDSKLTAV